MKMNVDISRFTVTKDGLTITNPRGKAIKQCVGSNGYSVFHISGKDNGGKKGMALTHRLVAFKFIPNPENKRCVNHIDGDKANNHVANLEWCTHKENTNHAFDTGLQTLRTPVLGTHTETGEVIFFSSMRGNEGFNNSRISECCSGKLKSHMGFTWEKV